MREDTAAGGGGSSGTWRASRRVIAKAAAMVGAIAASGGIAQRSLNGARAQESAPSETLAGRWFQSDNASTFSAASASDPKIFHTDFPFYALGMNWSVDAGEDLQIELAFGVNGVDFTAPVVVGADLEHAPLRAPDGKIFSHLTWAQGAEFIRYRVLDGAGNPVDVPSIGFTYIDATRGPSVDDIFEPASLPTLEKPPIKTRAQWGANEGYRFDNEGEAWVREYREVEKVIIHHTVTPNEGDPLAMIRSIYYYHAVERGWGDIGYNYLVDRFGNIYEGRFGGDNVVGGHAYQYAFGSSGIGTMGNFAIADVPENCQAAIVAIAAWVGRNLDPLGSSDFLEAPNLPNICGHRDVTQDTCPGDFLYADLPAIRQAIKQVLDATESPPDTTVPPPEGEFITGANVVTSARVNLRYEPSLSASINAALPQGELAAVIGGPRTNEGRVWYPLRTQNYGDGYVPGTFLDAAPAGNPPAPAFSVGGFVTVNTNGLALRTRPGLAQTVIATIPSGTRLELTVASVAANGYRWWGVYHTTYGGGWVVQDYLTASDPPTPQFKVGDNIVVNTDALYLRSGPGTGSSVIATMPAGTKGSVLGGPTSANGFVWYQISTSYGNGWAAARYLSLDDGPPPSAKFNVGDTVEVTASVSMNLRLAPGGRTIAKLPRGTIGEVIGGPENSGGAVFWQLSTSIGAGWADERPLMKVTQQPPPTGEFEIGDTVRIQASVGINMRASADASGSVVAMLPTGTTGTITDGPVMNDGYVWWRLQTSRGSGWVIGKFLRLTDAPPSSENKFDLGDSVRVTEALNMRSSATTSAGVVAVLPEGAVLEVVGGPTSANGYVWWQISSGAYGTGWSVQDYLTEV